MDKIKKYVFTTTFRPKNINFHSDESAQNCPFKAINEAGHCLATPIITTFPKYKALCFSLLLLMMIYPDKMLLSMNLSVMALISSHY